MYNFVADIHMLTRKFNYNRYFIVGGWLFRCVIRILFSITFHFFCLNRPKNTTKDRRKRAKEGKRERTNEKKINKVFCGGFRFSQLFLFSAHQFVNTANTNTHFPATNID